MVGSYLALLSLILVLSGFFVLSRLIKRLAVAELRWVVSLMELAGAALAIRAFFEGVGFFGGLIACVSLAGAGLYAVLQALSGQSDQAPKIELGKPLPSFTALDEQGKSFELASCAGNPLLLKFFRGHW